MIKQLFINIWQKITHFPKWYVGLYKGKRWYTKTLLTIVSTIVAIFLYFGMVDINFLWLFGKSPGFAAIKKPPTNEASIIYSADGKVIGKYFNENRTPVEYEEVNPMFWKALIDTEDERFYRHHGIDPIGMFGAIKDAILRNDARGASTITQQLAKNMFRVRTQYSTGLLGKIPGVKILIMKSKEWIIATKLELSYDKKEILTMYANTVDFGSNSFGIKTAAKTYFGTTPKELKTEEAAILVGMLKATTFYNPLSHPENSIKRRNTVLYNMVAQGDLSKEECDSICKIPIKLNYSVENNYDGEAQYFREAVAKYLQKNWAEIDEYDLYSSGLKIYTTIDTRMQKYAEDAAMKQMKTVQQRFENHWGKQEVWRDENGNIIPNFIENIAKKLPVYQQLCNKYKNNIDSVNYYLNLPHKVKLFDYEKGKIEKEMSTMDSIRYMVRFMHCSFVAMEPQTGHVKAWVGDIDFDTWKYDKVTAMRQPGSTFKLFVYTEACNQGLSPCDKRRDEYISMQVYDKKKHQEVTWTPHNADGRFTGDSIPLKSAFARSINSIAVRLGQEMGIKNIIKTARDMGIKSSMEEEPSLALGSSDVNLLELTNAYSTIANQGKHHEPVLVTHIVDKYGNEVYNAPTDEHQVIPLKSAFLMQQMLMSGVNDGGGTSQPLRGYIGNIRDTQFGGKTGTSNNHSDAWFMGVSPKIVVGAWVGGEYRSIHFRTGALGQGSRTALPICGYFLQSLFNDPAFKQYHALFEKPSSDEVPPYLYNCSGYSSSNKVTIQQDSIVEDDSKYLDENGNIRESLRFPEESENSGTTVQKEKPMTIDDF